ncbi:MAG: glycosyltransferase family 4 protein [Bauldia sp.]|nr:glycosyltransferase family 4 protein [Bauldia sp.]
MNVRAQGGPSLGILHIIPRFIGGGPERSLLAYVAEERRAGTANRHTVAVLDVPVSAYMLVAARKLGVALAVRPGEEALSGLIAAADIVEVHFWNHPALADLLRTLPFPPARVLLWSRVLGLHAPQVLTAEVAGFGDRLVVTARRTLESAGAHHAVRQGIPIAIIPGIADMGRLDGFAPRPHEGTVVGYIGVVNDTKMHPRFAAMSAAVRTPGVRIVVCGGGGGEEALSSRFAELGLAERVTVRGPVEDIRSELETFDVFGYPLAPDTYATSEKALQEAMWVGVPPVVFPFGGVRDLVEDGETGLVVTTEDGYASALDRLAGDAGLRRRLGDNARSFARSAFAPSRWTRELNRLMVEMMDSPRRARAPLPGADEGAAARFVRALGNQGGAFAASLYEPEGTLRRSEADIRIAAASALLANGEGGIAHHASAFPDDPDLRRWAALIAGRPNT